MRVVFPSVGYADMLAETLPAWQAILPASADIRVVTSASDTATQAVAETTRVKCVVTDVWKRDGASFNKAAALDVAFGFAGNGSAPRQNEVCLSLDADVFPGHVDLPTAQAVARTSLYSCARHLCLDRDTLERVRAGNLAPSELPRRNSGDRGAGYFQLFKYRPELTFGSFPTAGYYDVEFHRFFEAVVNLPQVTVLHLGRTNSKNWKGRRVTATWGANG